MLQYETRRGDRSYLHWEFVFCIMMEPELVVVLFLLYLLSFLVLLFVLFSTAPTELSSSFGSVQFSNGSTS